MGALTIALLIQAVPAQANNRGGNAGSQGGGNQGANPGNSIDFSNLPVLSSHSCSTGNLSLSGSPASACFGQVSNPGNDVGSSPNLLNFLNSSEDKLDFGYVGQWLRAGEQIQNGNGTASNFSAGTFISTAVSDGKSGTWSLGLNNSALIQALVISVKGGNGWSAYLFDPTNLASSFSGDWTTLGLLNNGGQQPGISHISAYYVAGQQPAQPIPTPALIPGAIGVSAALLRKKKQKEGDSQEV
jgi:hypothetical protein